MQVATVIPLSPGLSQPTISTTFAGFVTETPADLSVQAFQLLNHCLKMIAFSDNASMVCGLMHCFDCRLKPGATVSQDEVEFHEDVGPGLCVHALLCLYLL